MHNVSDKQVELALSAVGGNRAAGQKLEPRRIHPFPARMPLSLIEFLLGKMTDKSMHVLDPMVGSGTTAIAAKRLGRRSISFDRDPLAVLVARTSTRHFSRASLDSLRDRVLMRATKGTFSLPEQRSELEREGQEFLRYWFPPQSQKQLFSLATAIEREECPDERGFAWVVFSNLIIAKSAGASYALDISRSRPHKRLDKRIVRPFDGWIRRFNEAVRCLPFLDVRQSTGVATVRSGDARRLPLDDDSIDFAITSPPYLNAIDYLRSHKFSLLWMGHALSSLRELRGTMIGTERGLAARDGLPQVIEERLALRVTEPRRQARIRRYLSDLNKAVAEMARVVRPDGILVMALGPTIINTQRTDACTIVADIGEQQGLRLVASTLRKLNSSRRSLPDPSTVVQGNPMERRMRREAVLAFRKC